MPTTLWSDVAAAQGDRDCSDFVYQEDAQAFLLPGDPYRLDEDGDGLAGEALPRRQAPSPTPTPTPTRNPKRAAARVRSGNLAPDFRIVGLPARAVIGPDREFGLQDNSAVNGIVVDDLVEVEMRDAGGGAPFLQRPYSTAR